MFTLHTKATRNYANHVNSENYANSLVLFHNRFAAVSALADDVHTLLQVDEEGLCLGNGGEYSASVDVEYLYGVALQQTAYAYTIFLRCDSKVVCLSLSQARNCVREGSGKREVFVHYYLALGIGVAIAPINEYKTIFCNRLDGDFRTCGVCASTFHSTHLLAACCYGQGNGIVHKVSPK